MEDFNTVNEVEVVTEAPQDTEATETSEVTETVEETVSEPAKPVQSAEENARFAAARREAETRARAEQAKTERLLQALKGYGYEGDPDAIADALMAQTQGISQEEARAQREAQEQAESEWNQIKGETEFYKKIAIQKMMADDLAKIQSVYPEVKSLQELGNEFFSVLGATKDPLLAYDVINAKKQRETKPIPQDIGAVNSSSSKEKDFYSSAEIDRLTDADYDNPKIMEIVRRSIHKIPLR
jgi:hypothetical protein